MLYDNKSTNIGTKENISYWGRLHLGNIVTYDDNIKMDEGGSRLGRWELYRTELLFRSMPGFGESGFEP